MPWSHQLEVALFALVMGVWLLRFMRDEIEKELILRSYRKKQEKYRAYKARKQQEQA